MGILLAVLWGIFIIMTFFASIALVITVIVLYAKKGKKNDVSMPVENFDWKSKDIEQSNM